MQSDWFQIRSRLDCEEDEAREGRGLALGFLGGRQKKKWIQIGDLIELGLSSDSEWVQNEIALGAWFDSGPHQKVLAAESGAWIKQGWP